MTRTPETVDLDPDVFCLRHGKPLATKCASYCEDCEPRESDSNDATAEERAAEARDQMDELFRSVK